VHFPTIFDPRAKHTEEGRNTINEEILVGIGRNETDKEGGGIGRTQEEEGYKQRADKPKERKGGIV
jgi:hypothetical protein